MGLIKKRKSKISCNSMLLTGMPRSGTTFMGRLLSEAGFGALHEPFHPKFGDKRLNLWFPDDALLSSSERDVICDVLNSVENLSVRYRYRTSFDKPSKAALRLLSGGAGGTSQLKLRLSIASNPKVLVKDPFMIRLAKSSLLPESMKRLIIVRHPCAIWASFKRRNWAKNYHFSNIGGLEASKAIKNLGIDIGRTEYDDIYKISSLWRYCYSGYVLGESNNVKVITHEEFCEQPFEIALSLIDFLDLEKNHYGKIKKIISEEMHSDAIEPQSGKLHNFQRNAEALANSWRSSLAVDEQAMIEKICAEELQQIYQ